MLHVGFVNSTKVSYGIPTVDSIILDHVGLSALSALYLHSGITSLGCFPSLKSRPSMTCQVSRSSEASAIDRSADCTFEARMSCSTQVHGPGTLKKIYQKLVSTTMLSINMIEVTMLVVSVA